MTIAASLDSLPRNKSNSYIDATWSGRDTLQRRIIWLTTALGFDPRLVAASNLVFVRSRDAESSRSLEYADVCWPIHEEILKIIRPQMILGYGNSAGSPYSFLLRKFGVRTQKWHEAGHGTWKGRAPRVPGAFWVVGLPHLSRYDVTAHSDVTRWIKSLRDGQAPSSEDESNDVERSSGTRRRRDNP